MRARRQPTGGVQPERAESAGDQVGRVRGDRQRGGFGWRERPGARHGARRAATPPVPRGSRRVVPGAAPASRLPARPGRDRSRCRTIPDARSSPRVPPTAQPARADTCGAAPASTASRVTTEILGRVEGVHSRSPPTTACTRCSSAVDMRVSPTASSSAPERRCAGRGRRSRSAGGRSRPAARARPASPLPRRRHSRGRGAPASRLRRARAAAPSLAGTARVREDQPRGRVGGDRCPGNAACGSHTT